MIYKKLLSIQKELKAPKSQYNQGLKFRYRSCEDILEAVKPLLAREGVTLTISDDIVEIGGRIYVKATASVVHEGKTVSVTAFAREEETKGKMDSSQVTGASSSYARKYALNGLFCIDDTKDSDATNIGDDSNGFGELLSAIKNSKNVSDLKAIWERNPSLQANFEFKDAVNKRKEELNNGK